MFRASTPMKIDRPSWESTLTRPTYNLLNPLMTLGSAEKDNLEKLKRYFNKRWLCQVKPEELSIFEAKSTTNNGAESYHAKLKAIIQIGHPRIWNFLTILNQIIMDTDLEFARLSNGTEISWPRKRKNIKKMSAVQ